MLTCMREEVCFIYIYCTLYSTPDIISGTMNVSIQLDQPVVVRLMRKEKVDGEKVAAKKSVEGVCVCGGGGWEMYLDLIG